MEKQLTVRVPDDLTARLDLVARRTGRKRSELVRLALEHFLDGSRRRIARRPIQLVRDLLGTVESGLPDLGQRHRDYLLKFSVYRLPRRKSFKVLP